MNNVKNEACINAAERLLKSKKDVMSRWEKIVRSKFNEAQHENKIHLHNSLPQFLDRLIDILTKGQFYHEDISQIVQVWQEHAEDRALTTRYTIEHVIQEYDILRKVIFEILEVDRALEITPRDIILEVFQTAQANATSEFAELTFEKLEEKEAVFTYSEDRDLVIDKLSLVNPNDSLQGKVWNIEKRYLQKEGTPLWTMVSRAIFPASVDQPQRVIATMFDISEKKTHDLRTPLSVILDIEFCDLKQVIQESIETLRSLHGDRFIVNDKQQTIEGYWSISGLRRIIENLCSNAVKYGTKNIPILVTVSEDREKVSISVHNRGEPIPLENMESLFQLFSRSRSAQASGTTFTVTLPRDVRPCQVERLKQ